MQGQLFRHSVVGLVGLCLIACGGEDGSSEDATGSRPRGSSSSSGGNGSSGGSADDAAPNGKMPTGACVVTNDLTRSATWTREACPDGYLVKYGLDVRGAGTELTIEAGTIVKLASTGSITVDDGAALVALGTEAAPILFDGATTAAAAWVGLRIKSNNPANRLEHVSIRHAGSLPDELRAALVVTEDGVVSLSDVQIADNGSLGLGLWGNARVNAFDRVAVARNAGGAAQMGVPLVKFLKGTGSSFTENGAGNAVIVEATSLLKITEDTVWPNVSPAVYRIAGQNGTDGGIVKIEKHLVIEPGAVFEMASGSGFLVAGGTAGLRAVGTAQQKIVFRGVDGSSWSGITFGESTWADNRLERVEVRNASIAPSWGYYGTGNVSTRKAGILLGYNVSTPVRVALKDFSISGPNNAPADVALKAAAVLTQEAGVSGTAATGGLELQPL